MTDVLSTFTSIISAASSALGLAKDLHNTELYAKIAEMNLSLAQAQNQLAEILNENRRLTDEISQAQNNPLVFQNNIYIDTDGNAYCPRCYDLNRRRIHLIKNRVSGNNILHCPNCEKAFDMGGC